MKRRDLLMSATLWSVMGIVPVMASEKKILTAYFSRAAEMPTDADCVTHATPAVGNTAVMAKSIAGALGADLFEIRTTRDYPVLHRENSRVAEGEMKADERPPLFADVPDVSAYDVIFVGYPIWWYQEPMVIRTFLERYDWAGKTIVPFCTSMAVGIEKSRENIRRLCPGAKVLDGRRFETEQGDTAQEAASWAKSLRW